MRIDVHAHYLTAELLQRVRDAGATTTGAAQAPGASVTLDQRMAMMDAAGVDVQVLSVAGNQPYGPDPGQTRTAARFLNDAYKDVVDRCHGRFAAFGCVPLPHVDEALAEASRCLDELGFSGITLGCSVNRRPLDDAEFEPFWAELDRRRAVVFLHPVGIGVPMSDAYRLDWKIGAPVEDTVAALRLASSGLTRRFAGVRIIVPHLGGAIPYVWSRLGDRTGDFSSQGELRSELKRFYYDTVNRAPGMLCAACAILGTERIVLGTDFPYVQSEAYGGFVTDVQESGLRAADVAAILGGTAQELLRL